MRFLRESYKQVKANGGSSGVDGKSIRDIEKYGVEKYLKEIQKELKGNRYNPEAIKRVYIPKANGKQRPLGIPTIKDRIVQTSCKLVIEAIFEADFEDSSYGFRPKRKASQAIGKIKSNLQAGRTMIFDADISSYYDTIPHDKLLKLVSKRISDKRVIHLIKQWLKAPIEEEGVIRSGKKNKLGTPQGGVISPLLANIYLNVLDKIINKTNGEFKREGIEIVRYADDFVIMGKEIPEHLLEKLERVLERMGLKLNREKSKRINAREESFDFLGFTFSNDVSQYSWKRRYWNVKPSKKSEKKVREKITEYFKGKRHYPTEEIVKGLNEITRGWVNYFNIPKVSYPKRALSHLEWYIDWKFYQHYQSKGQRKGKFYKENGINDLVNHYGLLNPVKLVN
jgi:group II intron reverse transcriptase/maturase